MRIFVTKRKRIVLGVFVVTFGGILFFALQEDQVFSRDDNTMCAQVITPGRNPKTGEVKEFRTPCDVPEGWDTLEVGGGQEITRNGVTSKVYWNSNLGISFEYIINPNGYTLFENGKRQGETGELLSYIAVRNTKEYEAFTKSASPREGPPEISVRVFKNTKARDIFTWLNENVSVTNYNKEAHPVAQTRVGGVEAIEFLSDGLYMQRNYLLESNGNIYLIAGPEDGSFVEIKKDFEVFLKSIVIF